MLSLHMTPRHPSRRWHSRRLLGTHPRRIIASLCLTTVVVAAAAFLPSRASAPVAAAPSIQAQTLHLYVLPSTAMPLHAFR
jgi:hypothetical protein